MEPSIDADITSKIALATTGGSDGSQPKEHIVLELPRNPERTVALRKLLEAKDAAVRAVVAK